MSHHTQALPIRLAIALGSLLGGGYLLGSAIGFVVCALQDSLLGYCSAIWNGAAIGLAVAAAIFGLIFPHLLLGQPHPVSRRATLIASAGWLAAIISWLALHALLADFLEQLG
jgi:hypothetical protein